MSDVPPGALLMGSPAVPVREFMRTFTMLRKLDRTGGKSEGDE